MPAFDRLTVWNRMLDTGVTPLFYNPSVQVSKEVASACARGGVELLEFTNRGDRAWNVFDELVPYIREEIPSMAVGAGSITDAHTAAMYINSGADFIVGPNLDCDVVRLCNRRGVACVPGCSSTSEVVRARSLGAEIVKVFPARALGGPTLIKALKAPLQGVRLMPTGGVKATREDIYGWIEAGADCLGMGSKLVPKEMVRERDYEGIENNVRHVLSLVKEARESC